MVLIGNGSDDILTILTRAFVPEGGVIVSPTPSYVLYQTLAEIQGATFEMVPFQPDWSLSSPWPKPGANLTFLPNPNSPQHTEAKARCQRKLSWAYAQVKSGREARAASEGRKREAP